MDIPPPQLPPPVARPPVPRPRPVAPPPKTGWPAFREFLDELASNLKTRNALDPADTPARSGTPFDVLDIFHSAVVQLVLRFLRVLAILAFAVAVGGVALELQGADMFSPSTWDSPAKYIKQLARNVEGIGDVIGWGLTAVGAYVFSFLGCLQHGWVIPLALVGFGLQLLWIIQALSEEDEHPWLLTAVVPIVACQVYAGFSRDLFDEGLSLVFLGSFTLCWITWFVVRDWMRRRDLCLWELIDTRRPRFDPAFFRWRKLPQGKPVVSPDNPH